MLILLSIMLSVVMFAGSEMVGNHISEPGGMLILGVGLLLISGIMRRWTSPKVKVRHKVPGAISTPDRNPI